MTEFTLCGVDDCHRRLVTIDRDVRDALSDAALAEAEHVVERARDEFVPIDTGNLRDTIHVVKGSLSQGRDTGGRYTEGSVVEVIVTAGDDSTPQAIAIHEHPSPHDPPSWQGVNVQFNPAGRGPKFLERPLLESLSGMAERTGSKVGTKL